MEYIIVLLLLLVIFIIIALILRKKLYDRVDFYEDRKLKIMNRNVAGELAKVKELNLKGNTKDKFEDWKKAWDTILNEDMADVEELLYDTEKAADHYNFPGAKRHMQQMDKKMSVAEEQIAKILYELNELLDVEQSSRKKVAKMEPTLKELRKKIDVNRYQYSRAANRFELEIDDIAEQLNKYDQFSDEGNYQEGDDLIAELEERTANIAENMEEFPGLYHACKVEIPQQLDELLKGIKEMKADGYQVDHLYLNKEIGEYQGQLIDLVQDLEQNGSEEVKRVLPEIEIRMKEMYDALEQEALAKNFVNAKMTNYEEALHAFSQVFTDTKTEVELLKETYYFEDSDLEQYLSLEKKLAQLKDQLTNIQKQVSEKEAHTKTRSELESALEQLSILEEGHERFRDFIHSLRKDEKEARHELQAMTDDMFKINRKLKHTNLPGVPDYIWRGLEDASDRNDDVLTTLDKKPLDMGAVNHALQEAKNEVDTVIEKTTTMIDGAHLTEYVIQYANRYRSSYPILHSKLSEAEESFRKAEYELSLEQAAGALEEIEPGALKKVEKNLERTLSS